MKEQVTGDVSEHSSVQCIEYEESSNSVDRRLHQETGRGRSCGRAGASLSSLLPSDWTAIPSALCAVDSEASSFAVTSIVEPHADSVECRGEGNLPGISYQDMASITAKKVPTSKTPEPLPLFSCHPCATVSLVHSTGSVPSPHSKRRRTTYPSSKCLHRFSANCAFVLHTVHSSLNTTFFVVFAFLWNTGFV